MSLIKTVKHFLHFDISSRFNYPIFRSLYSLVSFILSFSVIDPYLNALPSKPYYVSKLSSSVFLDMSCYISYSCVASTSSYISCRVKFISYYALFVILKLVDISASTESYISIILDMTKLKMMRTVKIQKLMKKYFGNSISMISMNMLHVMNQLFTTIIWKRVTIDAPKSLKFIK